MSKAPKVDAETCKWVAGVIYQHPEGIKKRTLLSILPLHERIVRKAVEVLVLQGALIGSSPDRGFFVIRTVEDLKEATSDLRSRRVALSVRIDALEDAYKKAYGREVQGSLV